MEARRSLLGWAVAAALGTTGALAALSRCAGEPAHVASARRAGAPDSPLAPEPTTGEPRSAIAPTPSAELGAAPPPPGTVSPSTGRIGGVVLRLGHPYAHARVLLRRVASAPDPSRPDAPPNVVQTNEAVTESGIDGRFEFAGAAPGDKRVTVTATPAPDVFAFGGAYATLEESASELDVGAIEIGGTAVRVVVTLVDERGDPLAADAPLTLLLAWTRLAETFRARPGRPFVLEGLQRLEPPPQGTPTRPFRLTPSDLGQWAAALDLTCLVPAPALEFRLPEDLERDLELRIALSRLVEVTLVARIPRPPEQRTTLEVASFAHGLGGTLAQGTFATQTLERTARVASGRRYFVARVAEDDVWRYAAAWTDEIGPDGARLEVPLETVVHVSAVVVGRRSGLPQAQRSLRLAPLDAPAEVWPYVVCTDAEGRFDLWVAPGRLRVESSGQVLDARQGAPQEVLELDERASR